MPDFIESRCGGIAYSEYGDPSGHPLVLIPGHMSNRTSWRAPNDYVPLLAEFRILSVDPLGHGMSARSSDESCYTARAVVEQTEAVLNAAGVDRAHVWGFSRGGLIAALCAELIPDRCRSVVIGASPLGEAFDEVRDDTMLAALADGDWERFWELVTVPMPEEVRPHFEAASDPLSLATAGRAMPGWFEEYPGFGLNRSETPHFLYFGAGEVFAGTLRRVVADAPIEVFEGNWPGHAETMMDAEGVTSAVVPFLRSIASR